MALLPIVSSLTLSNVIQGNFYISIDTAYNNAPCNYMASTVKSSIAAYLNEERTQYFYIVGAISNTNYGITRAPDNNEVIIQSVDNLFDGVYYSLVYASSTTTGRYQKSDLLTVCANANECREYIRNELQYGPAYQIAYIGISCSLSGPERAYENNEITVTITPNEGYVFTGAQYVELLTNPETPTPEFTVDGNTITFTMPADVVQVTVKCVKANPYDEGGDSSINGGGGTFDNPDDVIDGPSLPSLSAIASGFIRMYNPTQSELTDFSAWLQDSSVFTAAFRDMFGKPIESVVSLAIAPFIPPRSDEKDNVVISGTRSVGIEMYQVPRQYTEIDCGEITPKEYWGGFLDYAPFTKTSLYLPYVGYREINVNEIMEKPLKVFYHIDIFTGASVCFVMCGGNVLYHYDCNVLTNVPFGATEYNNFVSGVLNIAAQSATIAAAGTSGVGAAMIPSAATNIAASAANMIRPSFPHSGVVTANSGLLSIKTPYLILERPRQATPKDINHYTGFPSYVTSRLSDLSGYTKISDIHLENVPASDDELSEIETLLRNGVIL